MKSSQLPSPTPLEFEILRALKKKAGGKPENYTQLSAASDRTWQERIAEALTGMPFYSARDVQRSGLDWLVQKAVSTGTTFSVRFTTTATAENLGTLRFLVEMPGFLTPQDVDGSRMILILKGSAPWPESERGRTFTCTAGPRWDGTLFDVIQLCAEHITIQYA